MRNNGLHTPTGTMSGRGCMELTRYHGLRILMEAPNQPIRHRLGRVNTCLFYICIWVPWIVAVTPLSHSST